MSLFRRTVAYVPDQLIDIGGRPVRLAVEPRARRVSLRLDTTRREVVATAPSARRLSDAAEFARSRADWIAQRLDNLPASRPFLPGTTISVGGQPCRLERAAMRIPPRLIAAVADEPMRLLASGDGETYSRAVHRALKAEALARMTAGTLVQAKALGVPAPSVAVMDARSRWGSCTSGIAGKPGSIRYSWRLILAPSKVLDYVVAHETAHLVEANHSPRFWAVVTRLYGDWKPARDWLKREGGKLHAYGR